MSPGLACALMAAATAFACVRCVVTFWADETMPATTASPTTMTRATGFSSVVVPERHEEQERQEHHGGVARGERAGRDDAAGDRREQRPQHDEADAACARPGAQVELDDAAGEPHAEHRQRQHGEVDDGEQAALVRPGLQRRTLVVGEPGERVDDGGEVGRRGPRRPGVLGLVEERRHPRHEEQAARGDRDERRPRRVLGAAAAACAHDGRDQPDARRCRRGTATSTACRGARRRSARRR